MQKTRVIETSPCRVKLTRLEIEKCRIITIHAPSHQYLRVTQVKLHANLAKIAPECT